VISSKRNLITTLAAVLPIRRFERSFFIHDFARANAGPGSPDAAPQIKKRFSLFCSVRRHLEPSFPCLRDNPPSNSTKLMKAQSKAAVLILALAIASSSCQRSSTSHTTDAKPDAAATPTTVAAESGTPAKWPMPEAMMQHLRNLEQDVRNLDASAEKDHAALAKKIVGHADQLISSCSMEGKAHDALHEWLMPFLQLNKTYAAAPDPATQAAKFNEIKDSLARFHERFE
jgi:hypothetical protein